MKTTATKAVGRKRVVTGVVTMLLASLAVTAVSWTLGAGSAAYASAQSALSIPGRGATVPFTELEAEDAATNGSVLAPTRDWDTLAGEASGRSAVTLSGTGKYVRFTLTKSANAVDIHYSIPDSGDGSAYTTPLAVYVNGTKTTDLTLTNKYDWFYGSYPFQNQPGSNPHHMYDDVRTLFGTTLGIGTQVTFQVDTGSHPVTIDSADFEIAQQYGQPSGSLSAASYGVDPTGATDSTAAMQTAVDAAASAGKILYVPAGTYTLYRHVIVNDVTVEGAGPWYTIFGGQDPNNPSNAGGFYGRYVNGGGYGGATDSSDNNGPSTGVTLEHFAIIDQVTGRVDNDQVNGLGGAMTNSTIDDLWIQHVKVGAWMDGPMSGLTIKDSRILDTTADGVNFHWGVTNSTVTNTFLRNTGDDGLASWSDSVANSGDSFTYDTVELPMLANNIALYGGHDNTIANDVVADTQTQGGGITIAQRFSSTPVSGTNTISDDTTLRAGVLDPNWQFGVGALWFDASQGTLAGGTINVTGVNLIDSSYEGIQTVEGSSVGDINLTDVDIDGAGTFAFQLQATGSFTANHVTSEYIGQSNQVYSCLGPSFTFNLVGSGNGPWTNNINSTYCNGNWPAPIYTYPQPTGSPTGGGGGTTSPPPATGNISLSPSSLTFGTTNVGSTSAGQSVTIKNTGTASASISGVSATGDFAETNTCGSSLAVNATCTATVTFHPSAGGTRTGGLTVTSNTPGSPDTASLTGTGFDPDSNLAQGKSISDTGHNDVYVASNAVDGNTGTYWESINNSWPQSLTVDLGANYSVSRVVLSLPPSWGARTETLSVLGSTNNSSYTTLSASAGRTFDPNSGDQVTVTFNAATERYVRLTFTGNTGWPAGQISEFAVYANGGGGGGSAPALSYDPGSLTFGSQSVGTTSGAQAITVTNTGNASATLSGFTTSGDFAQTHTCGASLAAGASCSVSVTFHPTASGTRTGSLVVTSNVAGSPQSISLSGTGASSTPTNLALGKTMSSSSYTQTYSPNNANDNNANSYWESNNNVFPQWLQVDLGASTSVSKIVLDLPPPSAWGTRTQTLSVQGSTNGSSFTTIVGSANYTFNPNTGNTVTITFNATTTRYVRLSFTANTGWPAGQCSEFQVWAS